MWLNPDTGSLASSTSLCRTPFEVTVHELGHVTEHRHDAPTRIGDAIRETYGDMKTAGLSLGMHAALDNAEFWAEATVGANTEAWSRFVSARTRDRLREFVAAVNRTGDAPLM
jgi:hypothetical protein